jgi:hypothetical protein
MNLDTEIEEPVFPASSIIEDPMWSKWDDLDMCSLIAKRLGFERQVTYQNAIDRDYRISTPARRRRRDATDDWDDI